MHLPWRPPGERFESIGIEAELEYMTRLGLRAEPASRRRAHSRRSRDRRRGPDQEVGDPPHAVMDHRELVDDIPALIHRVTYSCYPVIEGFILPTFWCPVDAQPWASNAARQAASWARPLSISNSASGPG